MIRQHALSRRIAAAARPFGLSPLRPIAVLYAARAALLPMDSPAAAAAMLRFHEGHGGPITIGGRAVDLELSSEAVQTPCQTRDPARASVEADGVI